MLKSCWNVSIPVPKPWVTYLGLAKWKKKWGFFLPVIETLVLEESALLLCRFWGKKPCTYRDIGRWMLFGLDLDLLLIFTPVSFRASTCEVICSCSWCPERSGLGTAARSQCFSHNCSNAFLSDHKWRINKVLLLLRAFFLFWGGGLGSEVGGGEGVLVCV